MKSELPDIFYDEKLWGKLQREYFAPVRKAVHLFVQEMKEQDPEFVNDRKIDFLLGEVAGIKAQMDFAKLQWQKDRKNGAGIMERMTNWYLLSDEGAEKRLKRLWVEIKMRLRGYEYGRIAPEVVEQAEAVPIEEVYPDLPQWINCISPRHEDKNPSMFIKGFAHCFSCKKSYNTINFVMEKENMKFPEAVNFILDGRENSGKS
jgi:hypothetical protein